MEMNFDMEQFKALLGDSCCLKHIQYCKTTSSTQFEAKQYVKSFGVKDALFIAGNQTQGRGRLNRTWIDTGENSLTFSILLRPKIPVCNIPLINLAAGLSVKKLLSLYAIDTELKWPNDIMFSGRKLCGILSESATVCDSLFFAVTGIGININSEISDFPPAISDIATSLKIITGRKFSREKLLAAFLPVFEEHIHLAESNPGLLIEKYKINSDTLGKSVKAVTADFEFTGIAEDINSDGSLVIRNKNGEKQSFIAADVIHLRNALST